MAFLNIGEVKFYWTLGLVAICQCLLFLSVSLSNTHNPNALVGIHKFHFTIIRKWITILWPLCTKLNLGFSQHWLRWKVQIFPNLPSLRQDYSSNHLFCICIEAWLSCVSLCWSVGGAVPRLDCKWLAVCHERKYFSPHLGTSQWVDCWHRLGCEACTVVIWLLFRRLLGGQDQVLNPSALLLGGTTVAVVQCIGHVFSQLAWLIQGNQHCLCGIAFFYTHMVESCHCLVIAWPSMLKTAGVI